MSWSRARVIKVKSVGKKAHACSYEYEIKKTIDDLAEIKEDVKSLLRFKWSFIGIGSAIAAVAGAIINLIFFKHSV